MFQLLKFDLQGNTVWENDFQSNGGIKNMSIEQGELVVVGLFEERLPLETKREHLF